QAPPGVSVVCVASGKFTESSEYGKGPKSMSMAFSIKSFEGGATTEDPSFAINIGIDRKRKDKVKRICLNFFVFMVFSLWILCCNIKSFLIKASLQIDRWQLWIDG